MNVVTFATGMTGLIGRHLSGKAIELKINLAALDERYLLETIGSNDNVIHLAGIVGESKVLENLEHSYLVNVEGTEKLARLFFQHSQGRFVYVSTSHVYRKSSFVLDENSPTDPSTVYAGQKLLAEEKIQAIFENEPHRLVIVRVFSVLGDGMPDFSLGGAVRKLLANKDYKLENCDDVRDFLSPKQAAEYIWTITSLSPISGVINLCSGHSKTVREAVLEMIPVDLHQLALSKLLKGNSANPRIIGSNKKLLSFFEN